MKDRKSFKNSYNAMEQELSFQKGLLQKNTKTKTMTMTKTKTKTKTKNEKDPTCAIFSESRGCKDIKYDLFTKKFSRNFHDFFRNFLRNVHDIFTMFEYQKVAPEGPWGGPRVLSPPISALRRKCGWGSGRPPG